MTAEEKIARAFKALGNRDATVMPCQVTEVDEAGPYCTVKPVDGPEIYEVRLRATLDDGESGIWPIPAVDSWVLVTMIGEGNATGFISMTSQVDKWVAQIGDKTFEMNKDETVWNGGNNEGLVIVGKLTERLNNLENAFNQLLGEYRKHVHTDPLSGTTGPMNPPSVIANLSKTQQAQIENTKVKH